MKDLLKKMIIGLRKQVEEKVPEKGSFPVVYEREEVSEKIGGLSHLILKVTGLGTKGKEDKRFLDLGAVNCPSPYGAECGLGYGSTQDILARLQEDKLLDDIMAKIPILVDEIDYEERHPYG